MPTPIETREAAVAFVKQGGSQSEAARRFRVSRRSIYSWLALHKATGSLKPRRVAVDDIDEIKRFRADNPDMSLADVARHFGCKYQSLWWRLSQQL
ncbi:MAG: hypothetical protein EBV03_12735 [Proteobacteria bacterium]|nr:hypothetical protein [Pseudomonadota bacterium]